MDCASEEAREEIEILNIAQQQSQGCCQTNANQSPKWTEAEISGYQLTPLSQGGGATAKDIYL